MSARAESAAVRVTTLRQALNEALSEEMARDSRVIVMGEDIGRKGGIAGVTKGLLDLYGPKRVIDTPISEMAIAGACSGAAMSGLRPVGEFYYSDMLMFMSDSIVTSTARLNFATGCNENYIWLGEPFTDDSGSGDHGRAICDTENTLS